MLHKLDAGGQFNYTSDCNCGLALNSWPGAKAFSEAFRGCNDKCIEVFWRTARVG
jgi:hypothetical protein